MRSAAAKLRGIRGTSQGITSPAAASWRSAKCLASTAASSASSGGSIRTSGVPCIRLARSGSAHRPGRRRRAPGDQQPARHAASTWLCRWNSASSAARIAGDAVDILDRDPLRPGSGAVPAVARPGSARPASAAQTWARWVLPAPSGPISASLPAGQSRQPASAAAASRVGRRDEEIRRAPAPDAPAGRRSAAGRSWLRRPGRRQCRDRAGCPGSSTSAWRTITPSAAATGTATSSPTKPNSAPKADSAKISQTGCSPTDLPTSFGVRTLPSTNWPDWKIAADRDDPPPLAPELEQRQPDRQQRRRPARRHRG